MREVEAKERESNAKASKLQKEEAILAIDETVKLLTARKKLLDEGICTKDNIDDYLPLNK